MNVANLLKTEVPTCPIHGVRRSHWYGPFSRYRQGTRRSWPPQCASRVFHHWCGHIWHGQSSIGQDDLQSASELIIQMVDAMPRRDDYLATFAGCHAQFRLALRGRSTWFCNWMDRERLCTFLISYLRFMAYFVSCKGWYGYAISICSEISASAVIIGYWNTDIDVSASADKIRVHPS